MLGFGFGFGFVSGNDLVCRIRRVVELGVSIAARYRCVRASASHGYYDGSIIPGS